MYERPHRLLHTICKGTNLDCIVHEHLFYVGHSLPNENRIQLWCKVSHQEGKHGEYHHQQLPNNLHINSLEFAL